MLRNKPLKRTGFKKRTPLKAKTPLKSRKLASKRKTKKKGYIVPPWFKSIPTGSHGNTPTQKRYWKVISNYVRQRDFNKYGKCVSCHRHMETWQEGDAAHFRRYSTCNSYFKFHPDNIALSCKNCNRNDDGVVGHSFGETLKKRYGDKHLKWIEKENLKHRGQKLEDHVIVEIVEKLLDENEWFVLP